MTVAPQDILGVVLAGGRATRMGGGDKGRLTLGATTLIGAVIARLAPQCGAGLVLSANGDPARFADLGLTVLPDPLPDFPGPLAGILAAMDEAARRGHSHVLSAAADTPFLPADLAQRLAAVAAPIALAASIGADGRPVRQPVTGLWPVTLREDLRQALTAGLSKVGLWAARHGTGLAAWPTDPVDPFFNVNTPEDLATAQALWQP